MSDRQETATLRCRVFGHRTRERLVTEGPKDISVCIVAECRRSGCDYREVVR